MHLLPSRIGSLTSVLNDLWRELRLELARFRRLHGRSGSTVSIAVMRLIGEGSLIGTHEDKGTDIMDLEAPYARMLQTR